MITFLRLTREIWMDSSSNKRKGMEMESLRLLPVLVLVVLTYSSVTVNGQNGICYNMGNFTANSTFQTSLNSLLDSISTTNSTTLDYGLFNATTSQQQNSEAIEAIGYCRGDLDGNACRACLNSSASQITQQCPFQKKAVLFEENCTLKYSNGSLYGVLDTSWYIRLLNTMNVSNWDTFSTALKQLLNDLGGNASSGGALRKYAASSSSVELTTLYAAVQCSPDLGGQQCSDCLDTITGYIPSPGRIGARVLFPSCQLRYETYRFFDPAIALPTPSPPPAAAAEPPASTPPAGTGEKKSSKKWIVAVASTVSAVLLIGIIVFFLIAKRRKRRFSRRLRNEEDDDIIMAESLQFNLDVIVEATENFSDSKKLGQGGFGPVYRGKLPNGQEIAVKRLSRNSGQGQIEFKNEVLLLAKLQHRNLVRLLGFCLEGEERLLVYEYVPNSSLDQFIFDPVKRTSLSWDTRYKIITGIARGLVYLHEDSRLRIIHRDLKASNILLDADMNPKVSDFGMARLFEFDQTQADTNRIVGTYGYMAPEYVLHGHFSMKSDVFSFGVLVLEIVSSRKNLDLRSHSGGEPEILISHVWRCWQEGKIQDIVDPSMTLSNSVDAARFIHIGLLCVQENVASRPTMASVMVMLNSNSATLFVPTAPAFSMSNLYTSDISTSVDGTSTVSQSSHSGYKGRIVDGGAHSVNEASITEPYPR